MTSRAYLPSFAFACLKRYSAGYHPSDSRLVLPFLRENPISVVVVDWVMPEITGGELLQRITADYPQIPVIVMTAMGDVDTAVNCMKAGAFDFLTKPVDPNRLVASVRKALQVSELGNQNRILKDYLLRTGSETPTPSRASSPVPRRCAPSSST